MKSVLFFFLVCGSLLGVLWIVVEKDSYQPPPPPEIQSDDADDDTDDESGNKITIPKHDKEKGRLAYKIEGNLENEIKDLQDPTHLVLTDGKLHIPIYNESLIKHANSQKNQGTPTENQEDQEGNSTPKDPKNESADLKPIYFIFEFDRAEYFAGEDKNNPDKQGTFIFSEGGRGYGDDGTEILFEELTVKMDEEFYEVISGAPVPKPKEGEETELEFKSRKVFKLATDKPVTIKHALTEIYSPKGIKSQLQERDKLQRVIFNPPVTAYIDPTSAATIFDLDLPELNSNKAAKKSEDGKKDDPKFSKVAVICDGPLILDRTSVPGTIQFKKDVYIYPSAKALAGARPEREDTWFHCQNLDLVLTDPRKKVKGKKTPPFSSAIASWPGDRIKGMYEGFPFEGDSLTWKVLEHAGPILNSKDIPSEAILKGRPKFGNADQDFEFSSDLARLKLNERKAYLSDNIKGTIKIPQDLLDESKESSTDSNSASAQGSETKTSNTSVADANKAEDSKEKWRVGLPKSLSYSADEVEIFFKQKSDDEDSSKEESVKEKPSKLEGEGLKGISRFIARSKREDGLVIQGVGDTKFQLQGRELDYQKEQSRVTLTGGKSVPPQFTHTSCVGTAKKIELFLKKNILRFEDEVTLNGNVEELKELVGAESKSSSKSDPEMLQILSEVIDVNFLIPKEDKKDEKIQIYSVSARTKGNRPVSLTPIEQSNSSSKAKKSSKKDSYRIEGPNLLWTKKDHKIFMKAEEIGGKGSGRLAQPQLSFKGGVLKAHELEFDQKKWMANLNNGVTITSDGDPSESETANNRSVGPGSPSANSKAMLIACDRAKVEFFKDFKPASKSQFEDENFKRIKRINAWRGEDKPITIDREDYSAEAQRATWISDTGKLHLFGNGLQKFKRGKDSTLMAEDITFHHMGNKGQIQLLRNVEGRIRLESQDGESSSNSSKPLDWEFNCPNLTVDVKKAPNQKELELVGMHVSEKIFLECKEKGIQLHGDDLKYNHAEKVIRIYSEHGRYQTLHHTRKYNSESGVPQVVTNKIDAREVRVWYLENPAPIGRGVQKNDQVVVKFEKDVIGTFYAPEALSSLVPASDSRSAQTQLEEWKLRANELLLRIQKTPDNKPMFPYAYAEGEVDFTSGKKRAMAQEAHFKQDRKSLILKGDQKRPVRLYYEGETLEGAEIELRKLGNTFKLHRRR